MNLLPALLIVSFAGAVRGYCGFGFAMIVALGLMLFVAPAQAIVLALLLDLLCSLGLLRRALHHLDAKLLRRLIAGMLLATPVGVGLVAYLPANAIGIGVAAISLLGGVALLRGRRDQGGPPLRPPRYAVPAGIASGLAMTIASAGGPPLMLYLLNTTLSPLAMRATAIVFFMASSSCALAGYALAGALDGDILGWGALLLAPALAGGMAGQWLVHRRPPVSLRWSVAPLLIALSLWVLWRQATA